MTDECERCNATENLGWANEDGAFKLCIKGFGCMTDDTNTALDTIEASLELKIQMADCLCPKSMKVIEEAISLIPALREQLTPGEDNKFKSKALDRVKKVAKKQLRDLKGENVRGDEFPKEIWVHCIEAQHDSDPTVYAHISKNFPRDVKYIREGKALQKPQAVDLDSDMAMYAERHQTGTIAGDKELAASGVRGMKMVQRKQQGVDVEGLKKVFTKEDFYSDGYTHDEVKAWNDCIDHLLKQGCTQPTEDKE